MGYIRRRIVGVMFPPSIFEASTFEDQCVNFRISMCRPSKIDVTMCRLLKIDESTFGDGCVDLRRPMCRPSKIGD